MERSATKITRRVPTTITRREMVEFGLVAILAALVIGLYRRPHGVLASYVVTALGLTLVTIIAPRIFYPFAFVWFGLSRILSRISSAVLLTLVFILFVMPVGLARKWRGLDPLRLKAFKKGTDSVLVTRRHVYVREDLLKTF